MTTWYLQSHTTWLCDEKELMVKTRKCSFGAFPRAAYAGTAEPTDVSPAKPEDYEGLFIFGIHQSSPGRLFKPLEPFLADIFRIPERRIEMSEDEILAAFFDGTEQPTNRPKRKQGKWYSGKKKRHTIKHQVVVVKKNGHGKRKLRIAAVSKAFMGKTHDKRMYEKTRTHAPPGVEGKGDLGFLGTSLTVPIKKPKGKELTDEQKSSNHSHSSERIVAEHGIGKMKIWRICRDQFHGRRKDHTLMFKNIAGFHNLMFA